MANDIRKPKRSPNAALTVVWRRIEVLRPDGANLRPHSPQQIRQLARSIDAFGFNVPILIDPAMRIIAGHGRLLAARELGWREVPTILLAHLGEAKARAFMIADNRLAEGPAWNEGLLVEQLKELALSEPSLAIEATGFRAGEDRAAAHLRPRRAAQTKPASGPEAPPGSGDQLPPSARRRRRLMLVRGKTDRAARPCQAMRSKTL